ncbi:hypothetical protein ACFX13_042323 [Malus domestica]|uniref:high mobility group B protein 7-like isoform X2 n=1 Tax=Malus domestica TaxID=3750 RepID=UPI000498A872|nr:uncharacterized protein LOC103432902 isoform X2 [Malus domestica]
MGNPRRTRKRVRAIRRAPDGSVFQKCNSCGASVPIALAGMHECEFNDNVKRFRGVSVDVKKQSIWDQLVIRAPCHFFLKELTKTSKAGNWVAINREGFEAWKNKSDKERQPYVAEAEKIDKACLKALLEEANDKFKVDDEADSAAVGNNGKPGEFSEDYENSDGSHVFWDHSATTGSWHTYHRSLTLLQLDLGTPTRPMVHEFTSWNWKMVHGF